MRTIALCLALLLLFACQDRSPLTGAVVFTVQCADGSFAQLPEDCPKMQIPAPRIIPVRVPIVAAPEPTVQAPVQAPPAPTPEPTLVQTILQEAPENYVYSDGAHTIYASGTKRSTGEWPFAAPGLLYWDTTTDVLNVWVGDISAHWWDTYKNQKTSTAKRMGSLGASLYPAGLVSLKLTGNKKQDDSLIPTEFLKIFQQQYYRAGGISQGNLIKLILPYYVKSPIETLQKYANEKPISVDTTEETLVLPGSTRLFSKLALTFKNKEAPEPMFIKDGETSYWSTPVQADYITFRFDSHEVPVVIDKLGADGTLLERKTYTVSETYNRDGVKNTPVTPRIVDLPPHIPITVEDFAAWQDSIENQG